MLNQGIKHKIAINLQTVDISSACLFRMPQEKRIDENYKNFAETKAEEKELGHEEFIFCRQCRQVITAPSQRIIIQDAHRHTFANPQGIIYEIGCFGSAVGCRYAGPATGEFTWFVGYEWKIAVCSMCLIHLGWIFISNSCDTTFNGLILDQLIEPL